eukprot:scaffold260565_cov32-Tisochrysis_lutea.AAC.5
MQGTVPNPSSWQRPEAQPKGPYDAERRAAACSERRMKVMQRVRPLAARVHDSPIGQHECVREDAIAHESPVSREERDAAIHAQPRHAHARTASSNSIEPTSLKRRVHVSPQRAGADVCEGSVAVNGD